MKKYGLSKDLFASLVDMVAVMKSIGEPICLYFGIEVELKDNGTDVDLENLSTGLKRMFPELEPDSVCKYEKGIRLLG